MAQQERKIVFFLGAGASLGAGAVATIQHGAKIDIPVQSKFWETFLRLCRSPKSRLHIESFLFRYFKGYHRVPARVKPQTRRKALHDVDVEEVFTFLSERDRAPSTSQQLKTAVRKVWGEMIAELPNVFSRFEANKSTRAVYRSLLKNLARTRDTFVSFNYDTVFEKSIPKEKR